MAKSDYNDNSAEGIEALCSMILMTCAIVVSIFFGLIKLRWFRFRMKIPNVEELPTTLQSTSLTEVRENCSIGRYSHFDDDNSIVRTSNYMPTLASSSSFSVKSKNKEHDSSSIFKWPFKNRLNFSRQQSLEEGSSHNMINNPEKREKDLATMEKNERLKRSIHEKLYPSASMPDLLQRDDEKVNMKSAEIKILTGAIVDETVDEIKMPKRPIRVKMRRAPSIPTQSSQRDDQKKVSEEVVSIQAPKPPTPPIRRQSRSNSLRSSQILTHQMPPLVMPRRQINQTYISIESMDDSNEHHTVHCEQPKSILKMGDDNHTTKVQHITFINVPDSSDSSSEDENDNIPEENDVWTRIDRHRNELKRLQEMEAINRFEESDVDETPPLPKTPPPLMDDLPYLRDFSFA